MTGSADRAEPVEVRYQFEYAERLRCAFVGAGGHAFRNIYPALQYAPVELRAVCDLDGDRAATYARMFGAAASYTDHRAMVEHERPDVVFVVTAYDEDGRVQATRIAQDCLAAGAHVWMEKPTAASVAEVRELRRAAEAADRHVMTGLKKTFAPAMDKVRAILASEEFGGLASISVRYPQALPAYADRRDLHAMRGFLDHLYHPAAVLVDLAGPIERFTHEWEPRSASSVASLRFTNGVVGSLHLAAGAAATAPLERVEVIGRDANVIVEDGVRVRYYRPGARLPYGRTASYLTDDDHAPLVWEPEHSLGQLYNKNLFYLGYVPEILHFCWAVLDGTPLRRGTLHHVLEIMRLFEAYQNTPPGETITLPRHEEEDHA